MGGRYETLFQLAAGGMATVSLGTVRGAFGFRQLVAIKRPHAHLVADPDFKRDLLNEARLASLIHHANVVDVRDVEASGDDVSLVMDYVEGASLAELLQSALAGGPRVAPAIAVRIALDALAGLQAAHELTDERGRPVELVHRDVSPQNLLIGLDGVTRVTDFGVAKCASRGASTTDGHLKGKIAYMAPEYLRGEPIDRRLDIFAMGVVLWETIAGRRLFRGEHEADTLRRVLELTPTPLSSVVPEVGSALDAVLEVALEKNCVHRFANAAAMAAALETSARASGLLAEHRQVAELVRASAGAAINERRARIRAKLAHEPSILSALDGAPPASPSPRSAVAAKATPETPPMAPPTTPQKTPKVTGAASAVRDPPSATLPLGPAPRTLLSPGVDATFRAVAVPAPAAPATTLRSAERARVPDAPSEIEAVSLPVRSRVPALLGVAAGGMIALAAAALAFAKLGGPRAANDHDAPAPSVALTEPAAVSPAAPSATAPIPGAAAPAIAAPAAAGPAAAAPVATTPRVAPGRNAPPTKPHRPAPSAGSDPPPNPYAE